MKTLVVTCDTNCWSICLKGKQIMDNCARV